MLNLMKRGNVENECADFSLFIERGKKVVSFFFQAEDGIRDKGM